MLGLVSNRVRFVALALALSLVSLALASPVAHASPLCPSPGAFVIYYSDASHTVEVGRATTSCACVCTVTGETSTFIGGGTLGCMPQCGHGID